MEPDDALVASTRDLPPDAGRGARLHDRLGNLLIRIAGIARPELSLGVRLLALDRDGGVFLVRHSYMPGWHLPGGAIELGETACEAATREAAEEGGLILTEPPRLFHVYRHEVPLRRDHKILFVARGVCRGAARTGLEIREARFFPPAALPDGATLATRARLRETLEGAPVSDHW